MADPNILNCKELDKCDTSIFGAISHLADERQKKLANPKIPNDGNKNIPIDVLSLLGKYPATHVSVTELLKIVMVNHKILHAFAKSHNADREFYCKLFHSWFIPSCSDKKPISLFSDVGANRSILR